MNGLSEIHASNPPSFIDPTKTTMGAMTMVGGDHFFLKRWVGYYGAQLGRENLYVLSHGGDPEHQKIAKGCNIIYLPYDETRYSFNQRRWQMMSLLASGFMNYYNWFLVGDVDELVAVDPAIETSLPRYLCRFERRAPKVVTPLAFEIVHNPDLEPEPLSDDIPLLQRRKLFRVNSNYSKPCITRRKVTFSPGGHFSSHDKFFLDPHLYLFHLRFVDYQMTEERLKKRKSQQHIQATASSKPASRKTTWDQDWDLYLALSKKTPAAETVDFNGFRDKMKKDWSPKNKNFWAHSGARDTNIYQLPERFSRLF